MTSSPQQQTLQKTVLNAAHRAAGARLVDFAGWDMPVHYGSQVEEHHAVRGDVGVFDVGHMRALDVSGADAEAFLRRMLANDVARLTRGRALYSCMLDEQAGILDDLIVYRGAGTRYRIVLNAATALTDLKWLQRHVGNAEVMLRLRDDLTILAVQGPRAVEALPSLLPATLADVAAELRAFSCAEDGDWFLGRTGYTGEDGFELVFPAAEAEAFWSTLIAAGVRPCGLGARDTLRLEAGMNLYGQDMDTRVTPMECGLAWTVHTHDAARDFVGRAALEAATPRYRQVGLVLDTRGVLRGHMKLRFANGASGETTSGSFSPTIGKAVALARVDAGASGEAEVEIRGQWHAVRQVKPPFVRNGQIKI